MSLAQFYRSVRHIPPRQLWLRLWLTVRRKVTMSPLGKSVRVRRVEVLPVADVLPQPVFPPRSHLVVERDDGVFLHQLNRTYPLSGAIDWDLANEPESTHLERLAFHYLEFLEAIDVGLAESIVLDWIERTPPWQPGYWLDTWNSYAVSIRAVCMMQWLAVNRAMLKASTFDAVNASVVEQVRFLVRNLELDIRGNHLMKNIKCLLWAGRFFGGDEPAAWFDRGYALLKQELKSQFLEDGMHFELSPAYHCQVFADVLECASVLGEDDRSSVLESMKLPAQVIADLEHPDGRISLFSDGGLNMVYIPEACVAAFEQLGGKRPVARKRFAFASAGYYGARFGCSYFVFDCGPSCADSLPAHGHGDILAFEWDVGGHRMIVDAGVREYETGPARQWNRSTKAHNTVTVGDRDQCEFLKSFRVGFRAHGLCDSVDLADECFSVIGRYTSRHADGQVVTHTRQLTATELSLRVADQVDAENPEEAVARLLLHHDCVVEVLSKHSVRVRSGSASIRVDSGSPVVVSCATWSPDFGVEHETTQLEIRYGTTPCSARFTLTIED
jgi:hypothetical protein